MNFKEFFGQRWVFSVALLVFGAAVILLCVSVLRLATLVPTYACHYGVWDTAPAFYLTGNDAHNLPNATEHLVRADDYGCGPIVPNASGLEVCMLAYPGLKYDYASIDGYGVFSPGDLRERARSWGGYDPCSLGLCNKTINTSSSG